MRMKTDLQLDKESCLKAFRTAIRLKHSLEADREIAQFLPLLEEKIDRAMAAGQPLELNPGSVFSEAGE